MKQCLSYFKEVGWQKLWEKNKSQVVGRCQGKLTAHLWPWFVALCISKEYMMCIYNFRKKGKCLQVSLCEVLSINVVIIYSKHTVLTNTCWIEFMKEEVITIITPKIGGFWLNVLSLEKCITTSFFSLFVFLFSSSSLTLIIF